MQTSFTEALLRVNFQVDRLSATLIFMGGLHPPINPIRLIKILLHAPLTNETNT